MPNADNVFDAVKATSGGYGVVPPNVAGSGAGGNGGAGVNLGSGSTKLDSVRSKSGRSSTSQVFATAVLPDTLTSANNDYAMKALSAGTFAYNNNRPTGMKVSSTISGVSNTFLLKASNRPELTRSIAKQEALRTRKLTTALRANQFNRVTGDWDGGYPAVQTDAVQQADNNNATSPAVDIAATPTRAVPGRIVYLYGPQKPKTASYVSET